MHQTTSHSSRFVERIDNQIDHWQSALKMWQWQRHNHPHPCGSRGLTLQWFQVNANLVFVQSNT